MLYKNHERVRLTDEEPLYKKHKAEFEQFLKGRKTVTFRTTDKIRINPTGYAEKDRFQTIPVKVNAPSADGSEYDTWIYCETAPKVLQNGQKEYDTKPLKILRSMIIPVQEKDKIFFLMYLAKATSNGRVLLVDESKEADAKVLELSKNSEIPFLLTSKLSPLTAKDKRRIAKSFGIEGIDKMTDSQVILALKTMIEIADKDRDLERGSDALLASIENDEITSTKAMIQEAIDSRKIIFDEVESKYSYANEEGEAIRKIIGIELLIKDSKIKRLNALYNYYANNPDKKRELQRLLGYADLDKIDFSRFSYQTNKQFAAANGVPNKCKQDELIENLSKWYEDNKNKQHIDLSLLKVSELAEAEE